MWFLEEEKLPVVSSLSEGQSKHKLLMKSPWEILQSPVGSGGVISLFSSHGIADNLSNMGVEYMEVTFLFTFLCIDLDLFLMKLLNVTFRLTIYSKI